MRAWIVASFRVPAAIAPQQASRPMARMNPSRDWVDSTENQ